MWHWHFSARVTERLTVVSPCKHCKTNFFAFGNVQKILPSAIYAETNIRHSSVIWKWVVGVGASSLSLQISRGATVHKTFSTRKMSKTAFTQMMRTGVILDQFLWARSNFKEEGISENMVFWNCWKNCIFMQKPFLGRNALFMTDPFIASLCPSSSPGFFLLFSDVSILLPDRKIKKIEGVRSKRTFKPIR